MFTGIIQTIGKVRKMSGFWIEIEAKLSQAKKGDSIGINGVCLTVTKVKKAKKHKILSFDLSAETLQRTTLGLLKTNSAVNCEPAARMGDSIGGHFVQGHVDGTGQVMSKKQDGESWVYEFSFDPGMRPYLVPKGSVAVDGISLTVVEIRKNSFTVAIIPFTETNTTLGLKKIGDAINLEADMLAKHIVQFLELYRKGHKG